MFVRHIAVQAGFEVMLAADHQAARSLAETAPRAILVLDCSTDGAIPLIQAIQREPALAAISTIAVIDRAALIDFVSSINAGPDIALLRPLDPARLLEVLRSSEHAATTRDPAPLISHDRLGLADIILDQATCRVTRKGRSIPLGLLEYNILLCLMMQSGRVMSRQELITTAWPGGIFVDPRTVNVHIGRLRKALGAVEGDPPIRTVRGRGYAFDHGSATQTRDSGDD